MAVRLVIRADRREDIEGDLLEVEQLQQRIPEWFPDLTVRAPANLLDASHYLRATGRGMHKALGRSGGAPQPLHTRPNVR
jgi:hypothetical protein